MPAPRFLGNSTLLGEPKPINWKGVGQALWEANLNPLRGPYELMNTPAETLLYDTGPAAEKAAGDTFFTALDLTGGSALAPKPSNALTMGIKAYHASPYSFDKFSMDKVGTGVGAPDAFSKGLYFSEAEKNAEHFKRLGASPMIGGKKGRAAGLSPDAYESVWRFAHDEGKSGTLADVAAAAEADLLARSKELPFSARRDYQRVIDELNARGGEDVQLGANMYEVNINADPSTFADWDAPISQQSDAVKIALADFPPEKTWGQVYDTGKIREAEMLKRGVSGTKFKANDGTPNYVVFDDKLISIVKKYGIAGASAMLGYNVMTGANEAQAKAVNKADLDHRYDNFLKSGGI